MLGRCITHGGDEKLIQNFYSEELKGTDNWGEEGLDVSIVLNDSWNNVKKYVLDSVGLG
jgi:hypothetical protein